jgi:hypothetical protein
MATWIYDEKFLTGTQFLSGTLSFTMIEDNDLEHMTQEHKELRVLSRPQELGDQILSSRQSISYDKSDRRSSVTTDRDSIDDYPIIRVSH